jgi:hypothetical protein
MTRVFNILLIGIKCTISIVAHTVFSRSITVLSAETYFYLENSEDFTVPVELPITSDRSRETDIDDSIYDVLTSFPISAANCAQRGYWVLLGDRVHFTLF